MKEKLICNDCGAEFLEYDFVNVFGNLSLCPTCNEKIANSKKCEFEDLEDELEAIAEEQKYLLNTPEISDLKQDVGMVVDAQTLCDMVANHLSDHETQDFKIQFDFAVDFDDVKSLDNTEVLDRDSCCGWYGIKTLEIFDENYNNYIILAIGLWGGCSTKTETIDLEDDVKSQVQNFVFSYFKNSLEINDTIALFANEK